MVLEASRGQCTESAVFGRRWTSEYSIADSNDARPRHRRGRRICRQTDTQRWNHAMNTSEGMVMTSDAQSESLRPRWDGPASFGHVQRPSALLAPRSTLASSSLTVSCFIDIIKLFGFVFSALQRIDATRNRTKPCFPSGYPLTDFASRLPPPFPLHLHRPGVLSFVSSFPFLAALSYSLTSSNAARP
jgi:hypothetical protein